MALQTVFDALTDALAPLNVAVDVGPESLGNNVAPPRVILYPTDESFAADVPRFVGPPRVFAMRGATISAHIWGEDWDATEDLIQTFLFALRATVGKSYQLLGGRWTQQNGAALVQAGRMYVLEFKMLFPVTVPKGYEGLATVTSTDTTDTALPFGDPPPFGS